jgi:hypothetical protein
MIENKIRTGKDPEEIETEYNGYYQAFASFNEDYELEPVLQEVQVWSDKYRFAGRIDFYGVIKKGDFSQRVLIDFKTSNFLKPDMGLQLSAYRHCLEEQGHKVEAMYILHLKKDGTYNLVKYDEDFENFLNVRKVFKWKASHNRPDFYWATDEGALQKELDEQNNTKQ